MGKLSRETPPPREGEPMGATCCKIPNTARSRHFVGEAVPLPNKKQVSKKSGLPSSVLQKPLADCYKEFKDRRTDVFLKICKMSPQEHSADSSCRTQCL